MKLNQIEYFLMIAEEKNFSSAAKKLFVSQPALSKQIKLLEEEVGTRLFNRTPSGVFLTEAGAKLEEDFKKIIEELNLAKLSAAAIGEGENQTIRIGCFDGLYVDDFLPALIEYISGVKPKAKIKIEREKTEENRIKLLENKIDILCTPEDNWLTDERICYKVLNERKAAIIYSDKLFESTKEPKSIKDFSDCIFYTGENAKNEKIKEKICKLIGTSPTVEIVKNIQTVQTSIRMGLGYAILAEGLDKQLPGLKSFSLPKEFDLNIYGIWKADHPFMGELMRCHS